MTALNDTQMTGGDERFEEVLAAYLEAADAGWAPSRRAFLERYPAWRDRLEAFFSASDTVMALVRPVSGERPDAAPTTEPTVLLDGEGKGEPLPRPFGEDYELLQVIGRGGMGVVYKARQKSLDRLVGLKMILPGMAGSSGDVRRFRNEADAAARMDHPNIVPIYEVGESDGRPFFSMKLVKGGSLADHADDYRDRPGAAATVVEKVARAVHHAHQRGIIHRDLKPANVLLDETGEPLVTDFGLARKIEMSSDLTQTGAIVGTPSYMAPEQASGRGGIMTTAVDVYALGAILYELLTGQPAFKADNALETLLQVREQRPIAPRVRNPKVPRDLETIALKCLEKDAGRRYASAADLADDLERFRSGDVIRGRRAGVFERLVKWTRRQPALAAGSVLMLAVLALGLVSLGALGQLHNVEEARQEATHRAAAERVARQAAEKERQVAIQSGVEAGAQRSRAESYLAQTQRALYFNSIVRAHLALQNNERDQAAQALDNCPADLRGWEWQLVDVLARPRQRTLKGHTAAVLSVACTRDGDLVASAGDDKTAVIWDARTGKERHRFGKLPASPTSVTFSRDGKRLACAVEKGVRLWDAETGKLLGKMEGHAGAVRDVKYSPDGDQVATADDEGSIRVFEASTGKLVQTLEGHKGAVNALAFSPDGKRLVTGGSDRTVRLWDVAKKQHTALAAHKDAVLCVAFSQDGRWIATGGKDNVIHVYEAGTGKGRWTLAGHSRPVAAVAFSPHGDELASAGWDGAVRMWSPLTGQPTRSLPAHRDRVLSLAFSPAGWLCSADWDGAVEMTDLKSGARAVELGPGFGLATPLAFSPDGHQATHLGGLHDLRTGQVARLLQPDKEGQAWTALFAVAFSSDGKRLATSGNNQLLQIWDTASRKETLRLPVRIDNVVALAFSPDDNWLAVGCLDRTVRLYDASTGRPHHTLTATETPFGLAFSPDSKLLAARGKTRTVLVWETNSGRERFTLTGHTDWVNQVCFSPDGKRIATASSDRTVRLWDAATGELLRVLTGHAGAALALAFSPDGGRLASSGADKTVRLWDVQLGAEVLTLKDHQSAIDVLAFSRDGEKLLGGVQGGEGRVQVWEVPGR